MTSSPDGMRAVKKRLADGTVKTYRYPRKSKPSAPRFEAETLGALILAYERSPEWLGKKPITQQHYRRHMRFLDGLCSVKVKDVRRRTILGMRDAIAITHGPGTANVFVRVASVLFSWGVDRGWCDFNPLARIRHIPGGHLRAWTTGQADFARSSLLPPLARVVVLARYTGQRRGDLIALRWSDYDGTTLRLKQQKGGAKLVVPVHSVLKAELDRWKQAATSTLILTDARGLPWRGEQLSHAMHDGLVRIGLPGDLNVHGLRKLAATSLAEAGCSAHEIAAITGHRTLGMVQLYTQSADQEKLAVAAVVKLERVKR